MLVCQLCIRIRQKVLSPSYAPHFIFTPLPPSFGSPPSSELTTATAVYHSFWCAGQYLPIVTLFRHRVSFQVITLQIPEKDKISRWFHRRYTVDLPSLPVSMSSCLRVSPSFSAPTCGLAGCPSNIVMSKFSISGFSPPESGSTVYQYRQTIWQMITRHPQLATACCHILFHSTGTLRCVAIIFVISLM